jgi:uncharacterized protein YcbX
VSKAAFVKTIGRVDSLWRYPIKSMGGERVPDTYAGPFGLHGDRLLAFESAGAALGKPMVTGAERTAMLRCQARFLPSAQSRTDADDDEAIAAFDSGADSHSDVEVETWSGARYVAGDPALIAALQAGLPNSQAMRLKRSERPMMDCRPIALISLQTLRRLSEEMGFPVDARRFRANILLDLDSGDGFGEDAFVGRTLRVGDQTEITIKERDPRCRIITIDPATGKRTPTLMTHLARQHDGKAGVYGVATTPGPIAAGDLITLT